MDSVKEYLFCCLGAQAVPHFAHTTVKDTSLANRWRDCMVWQCSLLAAAEQVDGARHFPGLPLVSIRDRSIFCSGGAQICAK